MDRQDASASEAFFVILEPGEAPPIHVHPDAEQVFFILEGEGELGVGPEAAETLPAQGRRLRPDPAGRPARRARHRADPVRVPEHRLLHRRSRPAPSPPGTATSAQMCADNGWDFDAVKLGPVADGSGRGQALIHQPANQPIRVPPALTSEET